MLTRFHKVGFLTRLVALLQDITLPITACITLYASVSLTGVISDTDKRIAYLGLAVVAALLSYVFTRSHLDSITATSMSVWRIAERYCFSWIAVIGALLLFGYFAKASEIYSRKTLAIWFLFTPALSVGVWVVLRAWLRNILVKECTSRRVVIAGVNGVSQRLASSIQRHPSLGLTFLGYFDDRRNTRLALSDTSHLLGHLQDLPRFVDENHIDIVFVAIPIGHLERSRRLIGELADTTASIYYVPDLFVSDLIQSRWDELGGVHLLALCETPFYGWRSITKRTSDIILATVFLALAAPLMLVIAIAVGWTTPGSIIFQQRRYGLDGNEITVYKFRTMTVSDDGDHIEQATRNDRRITRVGRFLRRYSLDELPQLFNVLQGTMSIVGPRPHAVAHNELYRNLIQGYMIRHKVTPGITGLAQVNGCRGETENVEVMQRRVHYDLQYLREWSFLMDLKILFRTLTTLFKDNNAY